MEREHPFPGPALWAVPLAFLATTSDEWHVPRDRSFEALIPTYLAACAAEGKSPRTVTAYGESLHMFVRTAKVEGLPLHAEQVSVPDVYRYLAAVRRRGVSDPTQHRRHREMKHFFSWLKRMEIVTDNPFQKVPLIRLQEPIVRPLEAADVRRLLDALDLQSFVGARDTAITLFLLDTGVRASELTSLNLEDVEFKPGRARVLHAKGKKQRIVAFGDRVALAIQRYLRFRGDLPGSLFLTKQGRRLRPQGLIVTYRRLGERAGVDHVHPHRFRHTFATMAIRAAAREIDVQHLLGHTTSAMVRRYTRTYDSELAALDVLTTEV